MNNNQKALKVQEEIVVKKLKKQSPDYWSKLLEKQKLNSILENYSNGFRNRIYTQKQTLSMFLTQAISEDSSCQKIVNSTVLNLPINISTATGAYCKARKRLNTSLIKKMCKNLSLSSAKKVKNSWKFKGRNIYLVDGTTITMPDTIDNQKSYPQPNFQKEGLGFPICRIVSIISLESGCIIDASISPFSGKGAAEQALLRSMLDNFKKGDIILADAIYSTYSLLTYVIEKGIDIIFVQNGARSRKTDFTKGKILGEKDHLIKIKKPKDKPEWMTQDEFDSKAKEFTIRKLKVGEKILISTMLCPKKTSSKTIKNLYKKRWHIEVDFRNIKQTLGLKHFTCKNPEMVIKEMWIYFLAYNIIRSIILDSAIYKKINPREISFKHALQLLDCYIFLFYKVSYKKLLFNIAKNCIGNREGRIEPRAIKKRHNGYPLLMKQRNIARKEILNYGHPKKLK